jgi:hypothetical protein
LRLAGFLKGNGFDVVRGLLSALVVVGAGVGPVYAIDDDTVDRAGKRVRILGSTLPRCRGHALVNGSQPSAPVAGVPS